MNRVRASRSRTQKKEKITRYVTIYRAICEVSLICEDDVRWAPEYRTEVLPYMEIMMPRIRFCACVFWIILDGNVTVPEIRCIEMRRYWRYLFPTLVFIPVFVMRAKIGHPRYSGVATASQNAPIHITELLVSQLRKGIPGMSGA